MRLAPLVLIAVFSAACTEQTGDPHSDGGIPSIGGKDKRIKDIADPSLPDHADVLAAPQAVSGAVVLAVDSFDETANGKSTGTIFVQDIGSTDPYSGISLFSPTFNPGNLAVGAGDVLDLNGSYTENTMIGATVTFAKGAVLPQLSRPTATFRFEGDVPEPKDIDINDLADFAKGRRWMGMLVRVKNVTLSNDATSDDNGRVSVNLNPSAPSGGKCDAAFPKTASLVNELFDMASQNYKKGTHFASITGVVSFFCNLHLAPRSKADMKQ